MSSPKSFSENLQSFLVQAELSKYVFPRIELGGLYVSSLWVFHAPGDVHYERQGTTLKNVYLLSSESTRGLRMTLLKEDLGSMPRFSKDELCCTMKQWCYCSQSMNSTATGALYISLLFVNSLLQEVRGRFMGIILNPIIFLKPLKADFFPT